MVTTSSIPTARRGISVIGAFGLAVAGSMLVVAILWTAVALVAMAAALVFGPGILASL